MRLVLQILLQLLLSSLIEQSEDLFMRFSRPKPLALHGVIGTKVQDLTFSLTEVPTVDLCPLNQPMRHQTISSNKPIDHKSCLQKKVDLDCIRKKFLVVKVVTILFFQWD